MCRAKRVHSLGFVIAVVFGAASPVLATCGAGSCDCDCFIDDSCAPTLAESCTELPPIPPPPAPPCVDDRTFVWVNSSYDHCSFEPFEQPLQFHRYVNEVDAKGFLRNDEEDDEKRDVSDLINRGLIGPTARLTIAAWDVDSVGSDCYTKEVDRVYFNDEYLGVLSGQNRAWNISSFDVPMSKIMFPNRGTGAGGLTSAPKNKLRIEIDATNQCWCAGIAWFALEVRTISPVVLLHGLGQSDEFWDPAKTSVVTFTQGLTEARVPWDASSSHNSNFVKDIFNDDGTLKERGGARRIRENLVGIRASFASHASLSGIDSAHFVGHSKGGLDSIWYLSEFNWQEVRRLSVLSLTTLDSPLGGAPGMDLLKKYNEYSKFVRIVKGYPDTLITNLLVYFTDAIWPIADDLSTVEAPKIVLESLPYLVANRILTISTAADMDLNGNGRVDCGTNEASSLKQWFGLSGFLSRWCFLDRIADAYYQISGRTNRYFLKVRFKRCWGFLLCVEITNINWLPEIKNDVFIPPSRARGPDKYADRSVKLGPYLGPHGRTHANIANASVAQEIVPYLIQQDQLYGDLRPLRRVTQACP